MIDDYTTTEATILENMVMCSGYSRTKTEEWAHDEITRLRADLAATTAERDRMREALSYYAEEDYNGHNGSGACARAELEGVTEPASPWRDIESAPRDGTEILGCSAYKDKNGNLCYNWVADGYFGGGSYWYFRYFDDCNYTEVTHWLPLQEPPR